MAPVTITVAADDVASAALTRAFLRLYGKPSAPKKGGAQAVVDGEVSVGKRGGFMSLRLSRVSAAAVADGGAARVGRAGVSLPRSPESLLTMRPVPTLTHYSAPVQLAAKDPYSLVGEVGPLAVSGHFYLTKMY